ncbi:UDP-galactopyranose mutase [Sphingomonas sp. Tas61C01]|uniref:UDP-galactopyranose mutase n=1 Tax=Sphingomonas sp. Tas61C01 TaxID=3458297 RepID=UPI00403EF0E6
MPIPADTVTHEMLKGSTVLCFSHLRWAFVFQRPQHLMTRFARGNRVLFWEEPDYGDVSAATLRTSVCEQTGVVVLTPVVPHGTDAAKLDPMLAALLDDLVAREPGPFVRWYYTPMMLDFSAHVPAECVVYDCMDELAGFKGAPPSLIDAEGRLFDEADLVFTGGYSLYEAKRSRHANIHPFPSSVDVAHFATARKAGVDPADQAALPHPRLGFYGVIDERMDLDLVAGLADARREWSIVLVGPVVKVSEDELPRRANLHYLGGKDYAELPDYLRGWDVALMPFAINAATRFISPTKTPEYLAAGKPVVSTPIVDVIRHYGEIDAVAITDGVDAFVAACDAALTLAQGNDDWRGQSDKLLSTLSWDATFAQMSGLIEGVAAGQRIHQPIVSPTTWPAAPTRYDVMIVGAGFAGAVMAERLASELGKKVLVVDRRPHVAGNAFDRYDDAGILMHQYGPHIFHTNSAEVFDYLSRFTEWRPYEHRVLADVDGKLVPMPINRTTLNQLYDLELDSDEAVDAFLASRAEPVETIRTSADVVVAKVGRELYETFFQGYTRKQWGMDPSELDKSVTSRVPTRTNTDDRYFTDTFQAMPLDGYTKMFERMLDHPNIDLLLGVDYLDARAAYPHDHLVFTGPIDEYFGHRYGRLPYRSLEFKHETHDRVQFQPAAVVNYPSEAIPFTRITEYKYLTGQEAAKTSITYEIPSATGDPYYPIPRPENQALFKRYEALAIAQSDVTFVGRLATYRYYNMDQVVGQAFSAFRKLATKLAGKSDVVRMPVAASLADNDVALAPKTAPALATGTRG